MRRFAWDTFCDWFLEFAKPALASGDTPEAREAKGAAQHVLGVLLRLMHPVTPFVTEELWHRMGYGPELSLIHTGWPEPVRVSEPEAAREEMDWLVGLISTVRGVRAEMNVPPSQRFPLLVQGAGPEVLARGQRWLDTIGRMARIEAIQPLAGEPPKGVAQAVLGEATIMLPLAGIIDIDAERARLAKERGKAEAEARKIAAKLDNADFVARAKPEVVEENRERLAAAQAEIARLEAALGRIAA